MYGDFHGKEEYIMKFQLMVRQKLGAAIGQESEMTPCTNVSPDGTFDADMLGFARRDSNAYVTAWVNGQGMKVRTQKDWVKNPKTKDLEKTLMVQNGAKPETYIFTLKQL